MEYLLIVRDVLELVGERSGREQRDEQAQRPPRTHAVHQRHRTPHMTRAHDNRHSTDRSYMELHTVRTKLS